MLITIVLPLVLAFIMFSLGLGLTREDFTRVFSQPKVFSIGLINQLVFLPLVAFFLVTVFNLPPALAMGTMIIALCPGGVTSNMLTRLANGAPALSISLTAVTSLLSIAIVPWMISIWVSYFKIDNAQDINISAIGFKMFLITAVPVTLGMLVTVKAPTLTEKISKIVSHVASALFIIIVVLAIKANWSALIKHFETLGTTLVALIIIMLTLGLITGKILRVTSREATTISLESGIQNATLGIAIAAFIDPVISSETIANLTDTALPSAVYGVIMYAVVTPFVLWRRKSHP